MERNLILKTDKLTVGYGNTKIIDSIDVELERGKIYTLIGPNGAGKTTLIRTLSGILPPVNGKVFIYSNDENSSDSFIQKDLFSLDEAEKARFVAVVLTDKNNAELMSCYEMVSMGRYPYTGRMGIMRKEDKDKVSFAMKATGVDELAEQDFDKLSDGQKQRVLLARAICQEPELLILDEPTSFLDIKYKMEFLTTLRELSEKLGFSVVLSLHELDMARQISDFFICVKDGKIDRLGQKNEIFSNGYIQTLFDIEKGTFDEKTGLGVIDGV